MRPTTGPSPFDELWDEMLRKYTRVSEEEAREGWHEAFDAALHDSRKEDAKLGGRRAAIGASLARVDEKLREVNLNFAAVEERIYAALQEALFELQAGVHAHAHARAPIHARARARAPIHAHAPAMHLPCTCT